MDDIGEDDISDTQFNDIGEDWSQRDSFSQSDETDKKRKREDDESTIQQKYQRVSVIVPNPNVPQFGAGRVEPEKEKDISKTGEYYKPSTRREVEEYIDRNIIFQLVYKVRLVKVDANGEEEREVAFFHSANRRILDMYHFDTVYDEAMKEINEDFETYTGEGSGWMMDLIESVDLHIARFKHLSGSSYIQKPVGFLMRW